MNKRTSLMVAYDILQVARDGSTKTPLVYKCNLNFHLIKKWLAKLIAKGLMDFSETPTKTWITTAKGLRFMLAMEKVLEEWGDSQINTYAINLLVK